MSFFKSFAEKLKNAGNKWTQSVSNLFSDDPVDEGFWDELEEQLILGDVGIETTEELITELRRVMIDKRISNKRELKNAFAELLIAASKPSRAWAARSTWSANPPSSS